ncbi:MAG: hypothetical protein ACREU7_15270, partial [Burkholderiales bacterium]
MLTPPVRALPFLCALSLAHALSAQSPADAVWLNGNIYTLDPARPRAEALAVAAGRIVAVGSNDEIRALAPLREPHDLNGMTVLPGLIDAHCHVSYGYPAIKG